VLLCQRAAEAAVPGVRGASPQSRRARGRSRCGAQDLAPRALRSAALGKMQLPIRNARALIGILGPLAA